MEFRSEPFLKDHHIHKDLFSPEECDRIIEYFKKQTYSNATVIDKEKSSGNDVKGMRSIDIREGHVVFLKHDDPETQFAFQKLFYSAIWANFGWSILPLRHLQVSEYSAEVDGGFYKRHRDIIMGTNPQRIITSVTQLSKPGTYAGSDLIFDKTSNMPPTEQYVNQGDTIFFTAIEPHEVTPILSGVRYSLVGWFEGPQIWTTENLPERF